MFAGILKTVTILAIIALSLAASIIPQVERQLVSTILQSSKAIENDPQKSAECFTIYMPQLNDLTAKYEEEYQTCLQKAEAAKDNVQHEVEPAMISINQTVYEIHSGFSNCVFDSRPLKYFECSNAAAGEAITKAYSIQNLSKARMEYIKLRYETIVYDQNVCTTKSSQAYVVESTALHTELENCLAGKMPEDKTPGTTLSTPVLTTTDKNVVAGTTVVTSTEQDIGTSTIKM